MPAQAIVGGALDGTPPDSPALRIDPNDATSRWSGIGSLVVYRAGSTTVQGAYTATAIDPWHVITAAHVVGGAAPADIRFVLNHGSERSHQIVAAQVHVHPDYAGFVPDPTSKVVHDDLAVVRLATRLPDGVKTYPVLPSRIAPRTTLTLVGYGAGGDGLNGVTVGGSGSVKRVGRNNADVFAPDDEGSGRIEVYLFDFDGPDGASNRFHNPPPPYQPQPRDLTLGNDVEASLAGGDSGSPALVPGPGNHWLLAGVNSFISPGGAQAGRFGSIGGGMLLSGYVDWIRSVTSAEAIADAGPEGMSAAAGGFALLAGAGVLAGGALVWRRKR
jgi:hypothetical protein